LASPINPFSLFSRRRQQCCHGSGRLRLCGGEAAEVQECGPETSVVVEPCFAEQPVDRPVVAGACGVTHDLPGFF
jgi:hypothetical protein